MQRRTVLFDFDGTLALGRGPLEAYAACLNEIVSEEPGGGAGSELLAHCQDAITRFDAGETVFRDAYDAIRHTALAHGVAEAQLSAAYLRSRGLLATEAAPIYGPEGLPDFLANLAEHADCVLATNAPEVGVHRALDSLGIADSISLVYCDVGKPAGLDRIIPGLLAQGPTLSVGDIWLNDLAPAERHGADTALVGVGEPDGEPTYRGATLTDLYDDILRWATAGAPSTPVPLGTGHDSERHD